jgi:hypothetical protein
LCEVDIVPQPIISIFPEGDVSLPKEPISSKSDPNLFIDAVSRNYIAVDDYDGLARVTHSIWLLDQVLSASKVRDLGARLAQLVKLDYDLRACLELSMERSAGRWGLFCTANAIVFRYG